MVHFGIPSDAVRFREYVFQSTALSKALYRIGVDVLSEGDARWLAKKDAAVALMRCTGVTPGTGGFYRSAGSIVVYVGRLRLESLAPIDKSGLGDEPTPPASSCDDVLTDEVETECEPGGPMVSGDGGGHVPEQAQWGAPPGGGDNWSLKCDVTFWYESWDGGLTWFYTGEFTVHWETCTLT